MAIFMRAVACFATLSFCVVGAGDAKADIWGDIVNVATAPIRAPIEATIDIIQGNDPTKGVQGTISASGRIITGVTNQAARAHDIFNGIEQNVIRNALGNQWADAVGALRASQRVQMELGFTSGRFLGGCLQGQPCTINQLVAAPVAASLRDAYKNYYPYSVPLDPNLQRIFSYAYPPQVVYNTRWVVGNTPNFTLPGFLNAGHEAFGGGHAVTIGNLIIFSRVPNMSNVDDRIWVLHEIKHAVQYSGYSSSVPESIDGFSVDYLMHYNSMESDAQNTAINVEYFLQNRCRFGC